MWRIANTIYRALRNVVTHRYSQDIVVPITTIHNKDDDQSNLYEKQNNFIKHKFDFDHVIKASQLSFENFDKLRKYISKNSLQQLVSKLNAFKPIELPKTEFITHESSTEQEEAVVPIVKKENEITLKDLSNLSEETMSIINNELAMEAFEAGDLQLGFEKLQLSVKNFKNPAAFYNLGLCYEQGIGVEKDFFKACDCYREAATLGHVNAFINLSMLSNCVDFEEEEEEEEEQTINDELGGFSLLPSKGNKDEDSLIWNQFQINLSKTLTCLS